MTIALRTGLSSRENKLPRMNLAADSRELPNKQSGTRRKNCSKSRSLAVPGWDRDTVAGEGNHFGKGREGAVPYAARFTAGASTKGPVGALQFLSWPFELKLQAT